MASVLGLGLGASGWLASHLFRRDELIVVKVLPKSDFADKDAHDDNEKVFPHSVSLRLARASTDCEGDGEYADYANTENAWLNAIARYKN